MLSRINRSTLSSCSNLISSRDYDGLIKQYYQNHLFVTYFGPRTLEYPSSSVRYLTTDLEWIGFGV